MSLASWFGWPDASDLYASGQASTARLALDRIAKTKPRLAAVNRAPSREEFAAWRDDPSTRFVMAALARNAEECREKWLNLSWDRGEADQRTLDALRERSDALLGFTADYEAFCETLGLEPEPRDAE